MTILFEIGVTFIGGAIRGLDGSGEDGLGSEGTGLEGTGKECGIFMPIFQPTR